MKSLVLDFSRVLGLRKAVSQVVFVWYLYVYLVCLIAFVFAAALATNVVCICTLL